MKWIIFTGTWRLTNQEVERDVRQAVKEVLERGDGIITGGALGVDWFCMDEVLKLNGEKNLKVIIPSKLETYVQHFYEAVHIGRVLPEACAQLEKTLHTLQERNPESLMELEFTTFSPSRAEYFVRDQAEVDIADAVYAFHVNKSLGTQDTIDRAIAKGIPILLHKEYVL
jgi:hypothetical protein